ncbi:MAG: hypothetical protein CL434_01665, partial [Acidimicrobiaceae bacterium]|nr:hypothetical protein [Acidimicrobiaceae bacterium]
APRETQLESPKLRLLLRLTSQQTAQTSSPKSRWTLSAPAIFGYQIFTVALFYLGGKDQSLIPTAVGEFLRAYSPDYVARVAEHDTEIAMEMRFERFLNFELTDPAPITSSVVMSKADARFRSGS